MGNNKSKTVNITTEPSSNKEEVVVGAGKVVGIEDSDHIKPQTNGNAAKEGVVETDKENKPSDEPAEGAFKEGDKSVVPETAELNKSTEKVVDESLNESKAEDAEVAKKPKKDKLIKKFSFRAFSFGKKDKQKPQTTKEAEGSATTTTPEVAKDVVTEAKTEDVEKKVEEEKKTVEPVKKEEETKVVEEVKVEEKKVEETPAKIEVTAEVQEKKETTPVEVPVPVEVTKVDEVKKEVEPEVKPEVVEAVQEKVETTPVEAVAAPVEPVVVEEKKVETPVVEPEVVEPPKVDEVKDENESSNINVIEADGEKSDIPPLPENPPPSQAVAFVESVIDKPSDTIEETIIAQPESIVQEIVTEELPKVEETLKEDLVAPVSDAIEQILEEASDKVSQIEESKETEQIEETIALLDKVNQGVLPSDESSNEQSPTSPEVVEAKVEEDIASLPLPQESFDSLSSPPTSNIESQSDNSFPPPPPPETLTDEQSAGVENVVVVQEEEQKVEELPVPAEEDKVAVVNGNEQNGHDKLENGQNGHAEEEKPVNGQEEKPVNGNSEHIKEVLKDESIVEKSSITNEIMNAVPTEAVPE